MVHMHFRTAFISILLKQTGFVQKNVLFAVDFSLLTFKLTSV